MREKALEILRKHDMLGCLGDGYLRNEIITSMIDFANQETEALQTKLNNERKMNESHVNTLLKQIEDKNKTNL
jgi:precorrin-2 methylase